MRVAPVMVGISLYLVFVGGLAAGADASSDPETSLSEVEGNITATMTEARQNATQNYSAAENATVKPILDGAIGASLLVFYVGADIGYRYPIISTANRALAPWALFAGVLYYAHRLYRRYNSQ